MKPFIQTIKATIFAALLFISFLPSPVMAAGLLKPIDRKDESSVKIKSHSVDVVINNGFAQTKVEQVFFNSGSKDLEAIYSFPLRNIHGCGNSRRIPQTHTERHGLDLCSRCVGKYGWR
jgi:Ca-activated chloride channel family protein